MMKQSRLLLFLAKYKTSILTLLIFIGEAVRDAFDPNKAV